MTEDGGPRTEDKEQNAECNSTTICLVIGQ